MHWEHEEGYTHQTGKCKEVFTGIRGIDIPDHTSKEGTKANPKIVSHRGYIDTLQGIKSMINSAIITHSSFGCCYFELKKEE